jgi:glucose/arabinose dehydrogenase
MLYIPLGDGGSGGDPRGNGQNLATLLGKILRIDVDHGGGYTVPADNPFVRRAGARGEIWAYGVRNPWRVAFDPAGEWLYVADVGQDRWEEIDIVPARSGGLDFGWNRLEGSHCFAAADCDTARTVLPAFEYPHRDGCSVTGGRVYRGSVAALRGLYFYADFCNGWIESLRWAGGRVAERRRWPIAVHVTPSAFGEDGRGELYVLDYGGRVLRIAGVD